MCQDERDDKTEIDNHVKEITPTCDGVKSQEVKWSKSVK